MSKFYLHVFTFCNSVLSGVSLTLVQNGDSSYASGSSETRSASRDTKDAAVSFHVRSDAVSINERQGAEADEARLASTRSDSLVRVQPIAREGSPPKDIGFFGHHRDDLAPCDQVLSIPVLKHLQQIARTSWRGPAGNTWRVNVMRGSEDECSLTPDSTEAETVSTLKTQQTHPYRTAVRHSLEFHVESVKDNFALPSCCGTNTPQSPTHCGSTTPLGDLPQQHRSTITLSDGSVRSYGLVWPKDELKITCSSRAKCPLTVYLPGLCSNHGPWNALWSEGLSKYATCPGCLSQLKTALLVMSLERFNKSEGETFQSEWARMNSLNRMRWAQNGTSHYWEASGEIDHFVVVAVKDMLQAHRDVLDPTKVFITGFASGGIASIVAAVRYPEVFAAAFAPQVSSGEGRLAKAIGELSKPRPDGEDPKTLKNRKLRRLTLMTNSDADSTQVIEALQLARGLGDASIRALVFTKAAGHNIPDMAYLQAFDSIWKRHAGPGPFTTEAEESSASAPLITEGKAASSETVLGSALGTIKHYISALASNVK